jgi:HAD superfamily hydrolase (TIGR01509 family)
MRIEPVFLFDLDGTLVDSVYQHVLAWKEALDAEGIELSVWRIHRKIGMSGGLFTNQLLRETGLDISVERVERLRQRHLAAYRHYAGDVRPLPGARELLSFLSDARIPWAIATSGRMETAGLNLAALGVDPEQTPVVTRDQVKYAKPDPDLFLAAAEKLGAPIETAIVVGDSIWDMLAATRCRALGVGVLSGGYGLDELQDAGAFRVYEDPADLLLHIDEVGVTAVSACGPGNARPRRQTTARRIVRELLQVEFIEPIREQSHKTNPRRLTRYKIIRESCGLPILNTGRKGLNPGIEYRA